MNKKIAAPITEAAINTNVNCISILPQCPVERRLLMALIERPHSREELDKEIGTTNSPEYVRRYRQRGLTIVTNKAYGHNRDGRPVWWGVYSIPEADRERVLDALAHG